MDFYDNLANNTEEVKAEETVRISKSEYERLLKAELKLNALECTGIDNWEGYGIAMDLLESWENE